MSIKVRHSCGFFSCCSVKLHEIVHYINKQKQLPLSVDSSEQFGLYKKNSKDDITYEYFEHYDNVTTDKSLSVHINYNENHQYINYSEVDYKNVIPIVQKYFSPSQQIKDIIRNMEEKYKIDYENTCVLFYRGNDKIRETKLSKYDDYIEEINRILSKNPGIKFLIQSDETEFIERMTEILPENSYYFKDEIRHMKNCDNTVDHVFREKNYVFSKYYLGITIMMSRCKYIICGSGNCSIWIMLYRGNCDNVYQYLNDTFIHHETSLQE